MFDLNEGGKLDQQEGENVQIEAIKQDGSLIQYIEQPSKEVQLAAVKQDGWVIEYIKRPSKEVLNEAKRRINRKSSKKQQ